MVSWDVPDHSSIGPGGDDLGVEVGVGGEALLLFDDVRLEGGWIAEREGEGD